MIKSSILEDKGYIFILSGENIMLINQNDNIVGKDVSNIKVYGSNILMVDSLKDAYEKNKIWKYKWNKANDLQNFSYDKIAWVDYNEFFDWYIVSSIYKNDLDIKSKEINKMIINISLVLFIVLILIAMFFIKKLLRPIFIMSKNAELVKTGNFKVRNNLETNDELGILGNHFDKMLDYIEKNTMDLESKVESRTDELKYKLYYDELTGLKNRESLVKDLEDKEFCALSFIDIEGFDDLNELYGFYIGSEILIKVADVLKEFSNENKVSIYRINSDVFGVLDTNIVSFISYDKFLEKIQDLFTKEFHIDSLDIDIYLYVTIGTSISQEDSIKSANVALKKAKRASLKYTVYYNTPRSQDNFF